LFSELSDYFAIAVGFEKRRRKRNPTSAWRGTDYVEQEHKQIVRLSRGCGEFLVMDNFEVNQLRTIVGRIVKDILARAVAMRPAAAELVTPKLMRPSELGGGSAEHSARYRASGQVFPYTFAWKLFRNNAPRAGSVGAVFVAVEHLKTIHFPAMPLFHLAPETNRNIGHAEKEIG
jgi:hypothetical protein